MHRSTRSRQVLEMKDERSSDRISSLPDELLIYILSFLSTFDAVKTSVLSIRWRFLFMFTSILSFDDIEYYSGYGSLRRSQNKDLKMSFHRFINRVLEVHIKSPIQKFSLVLGDAFYAPSTLCLWITAAVRKEVRHFHLCTSLFPNALPDCLFDSQTLVSLNIRTLVEYNFNVPDIVSLPSLKTLKLYYIAFLDGDSVTRFFIGCSRLKELELHFCRLATDQACVYVNTLQSLMINFCSGHVEFDAPNLEDITYIFTLCTAGVVVKNSCSISSVKLGFDQGFATGETSDPTQAIRVLITNAYNARVLSLMDHTLKLLARDQPNPIPKYSNLKSLLLSDCCPDSWKYLPFLLANAAQIETVVFEMGLIPYRAYGSEYEWDPNNKLAAFSSTVKSIEVHHFQGTTLELLLLKYLLENAGVLVRLDLHKHSRMPIEKELLVSKELLMLPKASTYCTIELKSSGTYVDFHMLHSLLMAYS